MPQPDDTTSIATPTPTPTAGSRAPRARRDATIGRRGSRALIAAGIVLLALAVTAGMVLANVRLLDAGQGSGEDLGSLSPVVSGTRASAAGTTATSGATAATKRPAPSATSHPTPRVPHVTRAVPRATTPPRTQVVRRLPPPTASTPQAGPAPVDDHGGSPSDGHGGSSGSGSGGSGSGGSDDSGGRSADD